MSTETLVLPTEEDLAKVAARGGEYFAAVEAVHWRLGSYAESDAPEDVRPRPTFADIGTLYLFVDTVRTDAQSLLDEAGRIENDFLGAGGPLDHVRLSGGRGDG